MHNYMTLLIYAHIVDEMNYIDDEIIILNGDALSYVG